MLGSSYFDPVLGIDIHWEMVPMPAPVPTPIPNPFTGMVFDPVGLAVGMAIGGAMALVTGAKFTGPVIYWGFAPANNTGTNAKHIPGHILIPPGTMWAPVPRTPKPTVHPKETPKPAPPIKPENDGVMITGSKTVHVGGTNAVRLGDLVMSCSEPVRLPSSVVLAVPKGAPILIGGPMSLDLAAAIMASLRTRFIGDSLQALISRMQPSRLRTLFSKAACFLTGHPVDVATGKVLTDVVDAELPGVIPLRIERSYLSSFASRRRVLGHGWAHSLDQAVWTERGKVVYLAEDGREIEFDTFDLPEHCMRSGDVLWNAIDRLTLHCEGAGRWSIQHHDGRRDHFAPVPGRSDVRSMVQSIGQRGDDARIELSYDRQGRLEWIRDSEGRLIHCEHDASDRLIALKLPIAAGRGWYTHRKYEYDAEGDLVRVEDSLGQAWHYEYVSHLLVRETDRNGTSFHFSYDGLGEDARCVRTWGDGGIHDHVIAYDPENHATFVTNSQGYTTRYEMNAVGAVTKTIDPLGGEHLYVYDEAFRVVEEVDAVGGVTKNCYDPRGNLVSATLPDGVTLRAAYGRNDELTHYVDAMGGTWEWEHDAAGRVMRERTPAGESRRVGFASGREGSFRAPNGSTAVARVTDDRRELHVEGAGVGNVAIQFDGVGRVRAMKFDGGAERQLVWDTEGRLREIRTALRVLLRRAYDAEGSLVHEATEAGETHYAVGALGRVVGRRIGDQTLGFAYDTEGSVAQIVGAGGERWLFERDPCGRIVREVDPHGAGRTYRRDASGRVIAVSHASRRTTEIAYDALGRVTEVKHSDGTFAKFGYRPDGMVVRAENESGTVHFERDAVGRTLREGDDRGEVRSQYDTNGQRSLFETSLGARTWTAFDGAGHPRQQHFAVAGQTTWQPPDVVFERGPSGLETSRAFRNGVRVDWQRDDEGHAAGERISRWNGAAWVVDGECRYLSSGFGPITRIIDSVFGVRALEVDVTGRLVRDTQGDRTLDRSVDTFGTPRVSRAGRSVGADPNQRIGQVGEVRYEYDADGYRVAKHLPSGATERYEWNGHRMLAAVDTANGDRVEFDYDLFARRTAKRIFRKQEEGGIALASTVRYVWDGHALAHEWTDGGVARTWHWAPDSLDLVAFDEGDQRFFVTEDRLGSTRTVHASSGEACGAQRIDAFGTEITAAEVDLPWRFLGQYFDDDVGLSYSRWRYYDPDLGAFISPDPLGVGGGLQPYAYVDNPTVQADPFGLAEGGYRPWQIHSPGYPDLVQKGLHFYTPGGTELAVRPDHMGGITFTNAIPGEATDRGLPRAIREAMDHFENNAAFRQDILAKARDGVQNAIDHAKGLEGSLRDLANGRSRELRDIQRNMERREGEGCTR